LDKRRTSGRTDIVLQNISEKGVMAILQFFCSIDVTSSLLKRVGISEKGSGMTPEPPYVETSAKIRG
jgi:hypothetical protein